MHDLHHSNSLKMTYSKVTFALVHEWCVHLCILLHCSYSCWGQQFWCPSIGWQIHEWLYVHSCSGLQCCSEINKVLICMNESHITNARKWWNANFNILIIPRRKYLQNDGVGIWGGRSWGHSQSDTTERLHFHFYALEKEMATHSSVLTLRIPGTGEPGGLPSMGSHRVGHDWSDLAAAAAA